MGERVVSRACATPGCLNVVPELQVLCEDHGGQPTPAPTAPLTEASEFVPEVAVARARWAAWLRDHKDQPDPETWMRMSLRVEALVDAERRAAREQADAEVARLSGAGRIAAERRRQIEVEGYTAEHDVGYADELFAAAACYALSARYAILTTGGILDEPPELWPWDRRYWKPTGDPVRDGEKAGSLSAAGIDAVLATSPPTPSPEQGA